MLHMVTTPPPPVPHLWGHIMAIDLWPSCFNSFSLKSKWTFVLQLNKILSNCSWVTLWLLTSNTESSTSGHECWFPLGITEVCSWSPVCVTKLHASQTWPTVHLNLATARCWRLLSCALLSSLMLTWKRPCPPPSCVLWSPCQICHRGTWWGRICWQSNRWHPRQAAGAQTRRQGSPPRAWCPWRALLLHPYLPDKHETGQWRHVF